nr:PREDICTED: G patch domain-containing protein 1 [Bemisia tabaci]
MSSDSEDEDFVQFGTPLEPMEEDSIKSKKFQKVEDQIATDQYGRRRFHGAFTGGYSAGFFNTVGSLEGWKPASFKSSKSSKAEVRSQRAEDFMDEEDTSEFGIAPKAIRVKNTFSDSSGAKRKLPQYHSGPIPGVPVLSEILKPVSETIGVKLLKSMGWKPGQGIGPRITKSEKSKMKERLKKSAMGKKVYGCATFPPSEKQKSSSESDDSGNDDREEILLAPLEFEQYVVQPKNNSFGIGYSGLDRHSVLSSRHYSLFDQPSGVTLTEKQKKVSIRGHAFGVGAFETEDTDIYAQEDMSQYDFSLPCPTASKGVKSSSKLALQYESEVIDGFVVAEKFILKKKFFPPPQLPPGFHPTSLKSLNTSSRVSDIPISSSNDRATILGEVSRWSSVEKIGETSEQKKNITISNSNLQGDVETSETKPSSSGEDLNSFKPFASDPSKQKRYEQYLLFVRLGVKDKLASIQPSSMTEWEKEHERIEFEGAFRLYKPMSGDIAERFTRAQGEDSLDPLAQVEKTVDPVLKQMQDAAKMKMFGTLTRQVFSWQPDSLVFKRFNIAETSCERGSLEAALERRKNKPKFSLFNFTDAPILKSSHSPIPTSEEKGNPSNSTEAVKVTTREASSTLLEGLPSTSHLDQDVLKLTIEERLKMFRDIFLDSSDDEDVQKSPGVRDKIDENASVGQDCQTRSISKEPVNIIRNTAPAKGIFANLDLDKLAMLPQSNSADDSSDSSKSSDSEEDAASVFGPQLPSKCTSSNTSSSAKISVKSLIEKSTSKTKKHEWIEEKPKERKHKKHRKDHKKHKSKSKKKKRKKSK